MSEAQQIALTAAATLLGGMLLFIASEFIRVFIILPVQKMREHIQLTLDRVDFYSNRLTNYFPEKPSEDERLHIYQIKNDLRSAATQLRSKYSSIALRSLLAWLKLIPTSERIDIAYGGLMYLHNSILYSGHGSLGESPALNHNHIERIEAALIGLEIPALKNPRD